MVNAELPLTPKKRRRGVQPGNQNARKHGFYSVALNPREICRFWNTVNLGGAEIAVVTRGVVTFDPLMHQGQTIGYIAGTLKHLSFGGPPWILQPRDEDDFQL